MFSSIDGRQTIPEKPTCQRALMSVLRGTQGVLINGVIQQRVVCHNQCDQKKIAKCL